MRLAIIFPSERVRDAVMQRDMQYGFNVTYMARKGFVNKPGGGEIITFCIRDASDIEKLIGHTADVVLYHGSFLRQADADLIHRVQAHAQLSLLRP